MEADWHVLMVSAEALHLLLSCWQMKSEMTLMARAEPWLKSVWSTAAKDCSLGRSFCEPNETAGSPHEPKSRAAAWRFLLERFLAEAAALHAVSVGVGKKHWSVHFCILWRSSFRVRMTGTYLEHHSRRRRRSRSQSWLRWRRRCAGRRSSSAGRRRR